MRVCNVLSHFEIKAHGMAEKEDTMQYDLIVIGGGPAGLMAAGTAAERGVRTLLLERMPRIGTKLRITGKGRCNITNARPIESYLPFLHGNVALAQNALQRFTNQQIVELLNAEGVSTILERGDRIYPLSGRASDVAEAFIRYCTRHGVTIKTEVLVTALTPTDEGWKVTSSIGECYEARGVFLACGGKSYPRTGSDGAGYTLAAMIGHTTTEIFQTLVGFTVNTDWTVRERLLVKNVGLRLLVEGEEVGQQNPVDIELIDAWVGGPGVLRLSRLAMEHLRAGQRVQLQIDFKPALSEQKLLARLQRDIQERRSELLRSVARAWLPAGLIKPLLRRARLSGQTKVGMLTDKELVALSAALKCFDVQLLEPDDWERAVVTAGGISNDEIDPLTLRSLKHRGVYFCGELLDIDGNTGGFNLQLAYSTGYVAGCEAAKELLISNAE